MSSKNTSRESVNERRSSIKMRESTSGKGGFFSSFGNISSLSSKVQKKVRKVGQKVGQQLNLVTLSSKNNEEEIKDDNIVLNFDFPTTESFIGENPLSRNNRDTDYMRDTEYAFSEIDEENEEEEDDDDEEEVEEEEDGEEENEEIEEGEEEEEDVPEETDLIDANDDDEFLNMLRALLREVEIRDFDSERIGRDSENRRGSETKEGTIVTGHHDHKLKVITDLRRMRRNICNVCKETGGCITYCDIRWDCDFDMCYECYLKESDICNKHKTSTKERDDECFDCKALTRISEGAMMNPSIFDNSPTKSRKLTFKEHHSQRINVMCLYIPPVNSRKTLATIITASDDWTVCIWNLFSGALIRRLENEHEGPITAMELYQNPLDENEVSIITGSEDRTVKIWSYYKGKVDKYLKLKNSGRITGIATFRQTSADGKVGVYIVSVDQGSTGCIFNYHSGVFLRKFTNNLFVNIPILKVVACYWKSGNVDQCAIVTADEKNRLVAWSLAGEKMFEFDTKNGNHVQGEKITSMIAINNGDTLEDVRIVTGAEDSQIFMWKFIEKPTSATAVNRFMVGHKDCAVNGLAFYKHNKSDIKLLSVGEDGGLLVWDYYRAFRRLEGQNPFKYPIFSLSADDKHDPLTCVSVYVNPNDRREVYVVTSTDSGRVNIWELPEDEKLKAVQNEERKAAVSTTDASPSYYFKTLARQGSAAMESIGLIQQEDEVFDTTDFLDFGVQDIVSGHKKKIRRVVYCDLDNTVITGSLDRTAIQWTISDGRVKFKLDGDHHASIAGIAVIPIVTSANQSTYEVLTVDFKGFCIIWINGTFKDSFEICNGDIHEKRKMINGLSYYRRQSTDYILTVSGDAMCCIWDYHTRKLVCKLEDGHSAAVLNVCVLKFKSKEYIFTCSRDSTILMWSFEPEESETKSRAIVLCKFEGHDDEVNQVVAFTYIENRSEKVAIISCSDDRTCALWNVSFNPDIKVSKPTKRFGETGYNRNEDQHNRLVISIGLFGSQAQAKPLEDTYFISVGIDEKTIAWNCVSGFHFELKNAKNKGMHVDSIFRVVVAGTNVITVSDDSTGIIWEVSDIKAKTFKYGKQLRAFSYVKGLALTYATREVEIYRKDAVKSTNKREVTEDALKVVKELTNLEIWRQGQFIVGFCFISTDKEEKGFFAQEATLSKTFGHIYYIDIDTRKVNYYYKLEIDDSVANKPEWLQNQMYYSLKFKALSYYCRFNDAKGIRRILKKFFKELSHYESNVADVYKCTSDIGFKQLTSIPLIDPLGLRELAYKFPIILRNFVCRLRLIDCSSVMFSTEVFKAVYPDIVHIESRPGFDVSGDYCWNEKDIRRVNEKHRIMIEENSDTELMSLFVPLPHAGSFEMLEAYVHSCKVLNDVSLFDNEVVLTGLHYAWRTFGIYAHLRHFFIFAFFIAALMLSTFTFSRWRTNYPRVTLGIQILVLVLVGYLVKEEVLDLISESIQTREDTIKKEEEQSSSKYHPQIEVLVQKLNKNFRKVEKLFRKLKFAAKSIFEHFSNPWNAFDIVFHAVTTVGTSYRIIYWRDSQISTSCLAVAILFAWIKAVYFLQAFRHTGPLVAMIAHIIKEIMPFLGVLFMILIGFTSAFFLLSQNDDALPFGTIRGGFLHAFDYMLGNFESDFSGTTNPQLATVLFILYMLFALVVMFNLLIAIMSNAYTEVQAKGLSHWRFEQATLILELKRKLPRHYMNAVSDTYAKTRIKCFPWYQQSDTSERNWGLQLLEIGKSMFREEIPLLGEGCYLHVLQRRASYTNQGNDQSKDDKKIAATDDKIKTMESKLDAIIEALTANNIMKK